MTTKARRHEEEPEKENSERWLLTYADMITLLLALFIVLFATSTISTKKFIALAIGFKAAFNPTPGLLNNQSNGLLAQASLTQADGTHTVNLKSISPPIVPITPVTSTTLAGANGAQGTGNNGGSNNAGTQALAQLQQKLEQILQNKGLSAEVSSTIQTRGLVVQILTGTVFFETGSATLGTAGDAIVDTIASVLAEVPNNIEVEGYTDDQPDTGPPYYSNLELSSVRADNVATRLMSVDGIPEARVIATGYGPNDSVVPNNSPSNMALNRRMDVVVIPIGAQAS